MKLFYFLTGSFSIPSSFLTFYTLVSERTGYFDFQTSYPAFLKVDGGAYKYNKKFKQKQDFQQDDQRVNALKDLAFLSSSFSRFA